MPLQLSLLTSSRTPNPSPSAVRVATVPESFRSAERRALLGFSAPVARVREPYGSPVMLRAGIYF
jgi:hypothetical protein